MSVKHIEVLVEEESMEAVLRILIPRMIGATSFEVYRYQGKPDLLEKLPERLKGYSRWLPADWRILVVVDRDDEDCHHLKQKLDSFASTNGLTPRTQVINRIAVEELEAWYFGDWEALTACYGKLSTDVPRKARYRDPDAIQGGTWENLERIFQRVGYYKSGLPKIELAETVSPMMNPARNRSRSFRVFRDTLLELVKE